MKSRIGDKANEKSAIQSYFDAQKLAWGPIMFQATVCLRDLGILREINASRTGIDHAELRSKTGLSEYAVKVLLEVALCLDLVEKQEDGFVLTKIGYIVLTDPMTNRNIDFVKDVNYRGFEYLKESFKTGIPEGLKVFGSWPTIYEGLSELPNKVQESWFNFDHFYSDNAFDEVLPHLFDKRNIKRILDVGGNTGKFAIACCKYSSEAEVTIMDLPGQLEKAKKHINEAGFESRVNTISLNLLDHTIPFPKGYDLIWMGQFIDCFAKEDILQLMLRTREAMGKDTLYGILESYWDDQRFLAAKYSVVATSLYFTCMANGCSQMYQSKDIEDLLKQSGLFLKERYSNLGWGSTLFLVESTS